MKFSETATERQMIDIRVEQENGITTAHFAGDLTSAEGQELTKLLSDSAAGESAKLLINLSGIKMIDSEGLSSLITLVNRARLSGGRVVLAAPSPFVENVFRVTRLDTWFDMAADVTAAEQKLMKG